MQKQFMVNIIICIMLVIALNGCNSGSSSSSGFMGTYENVDDSSKYLVFDESGVVLYENGNQIRSGEHRLHSDRQLIISYKDFGELYSFDENREILFQGNANRDDTGKATYIKEGISRDNLDERERSQKAYIESLKNKSVGKDAAKPTPTTARKTSSKSIGNEITLESTLDFSEDRAWVKYSKQINGDMKYISAVIDTKGHILWESEPVGIIEYVKTPFRDGMACIAKTVYDVLTGPQLVAIIDSNGDVTYSPKENEYTILGYGDGKFLVAQLVSNFDSNEWRIGAIDKNGEIVVPLKSYPHINGSKMRFDTSGDFKYVECFYYGANIFYLKFESSAQLLNIETQSIIVNSEDMGGFVPINFYTNFENGHAVIAFGRDGVFKDLWRGKYEDGVYKLGTDGNIIEKLAGRWTNRILNFSEGLAFIRDSESGYGFPNNGGAYYNINGEKVLDFPEYHGNREYNCSPFQDGYAAMAMKGADGLMYYTIIDKSGKQMFEPQSAIQSLWTRDNNYAVARLSYVPERVYDTLMVINMAGQPLKSVVYIGSVNKFTDVYTVSCGMLNIGNAYVNVEDGTIIGKLDSQEYSIVSH